MKIITLDQIKAVLPKIDLIAEIEAGFVAYSQNKAVVPPVGELILDKGEVHIKYGYIKEDPYYVIKIASGFYQNPRMGLPSSNGLMLAFSQRTGELAAVLLDEGHLTDVRTAVAGAIAAKHLAPKNIHHIGIIGTGTQATVQLQYLEKVTDCRDVLVWGLSDEMVNTYIQRFADSDFKIKRAKTTAEIMRQCNLIVTTTPSDEPLVRLADLQPGTHFTAVGSDTPFKQELDTDILAEAHVLVADSVSQCLTRGEIFQALRTKVISADKVVELGNVISGKATGRTDDNQVSIADLTGVAVQDIKIASAVYHALAKG